MEELRHVTELRVINAPGPGLQGQQGMPRAAVSCVIPEPRPHLKAPSERGAPRTGPKGEWAGAAPAQLYMRMGRDALEYRPYAVDYPQ